MTDDFVVRGRAMKPESNFANFDVVLPNRARGHVQFVTTLLAPFDVGPNAQADSITNAIISTVHPDGRVVRLAEGTVFGSTKDFYDEYEGFKRAYGKALVALSEQFSRAIEDVFFDMFPVAHDSLELRAKSIALARLREDSEKITKRMRAFMWEAFLKFFPDGEV